MQDYGKQEGFTSKLQNALPKILAAASIALSAWLTVRFGLALELSESVSVIIAIGLVWELAKYTFARESWRLLRGLRPREVIAGASLLGLVLVLVAGSVTASVAAIESVRSGEQAHMAKAITTGIAARQMRDEIDVLLASAKTDVELGYRARANETQQRVAMIREDLEALQSSAMITADVSGLFPRAGAVWWVIAVTIAVMLDVISIVSVALAGGGTIATPAQQKSSDSVKRAIASGKVKPTYREVMGYGDGFSQEQAKGVLDDLEACGVLERNGRGWRLS